MVVTLVVLFACFGAIVQMICINDYIHSVYDSFVILFLCAKRRSWSSFIDGRWTMNLKRMRKWMVRAALVAIMSTSPLSVNGLGVSVLTLTMRTRHWLISYWLQYHSCAILSSGTMKCWGSNGDGQVMIVALFENALGLHMLSLFTNLSFFLIRSETAHQEQIDLHLLKLMAWAVELNLSR